MEFASLQPGARVGQYVIERQVAVGGSAVVYQARDPRARRNVAVKVLGADLANGSDGGRRLLHEARSYTRLVHPRIVTLFEVGELDGTPYLVMEWVDGVTLAERLESGPLDQQECLRIMTQVADGLSAAHALGLAHRDVKPANIMLTPEGDAKLLDFGLAKQIGPTMPKSWVTTDGSLLGTPAYMSPEQAHGQTLTLASDVFSFGAVLVEVVTGRPAFGRKTTLATLNAVTRAEVEPLPRRGGRIGKGLADLAAWCLQREPGDRPQDARELVVELSRLSGGRATTRRYPRRMWLAAVAAAVVLVSAAVVATLTLSDATAGDPAPKTGARVLQIGGNSPRVASDGSFFVYCSDDDREIWSSPVDGGRSTRIRHGDDAVTGLCLTPDDRQVLFVTGEHSGSPWIWEIPVDSGVARKITRGFSPAVSHDGMLVAALLELEGEARQLFVCHRDGTERRTLAHFDGSRRPLNCAFSDDGSTVLLVVTDGVHWSRLVRVDSATGAVEQITEVQGIASRGLAVLPGSKEAVWCLRPVSSAPTMLWATDIENGRTRPVHPGPGLASHPSVTADGSRLLVDIVSRELELVEVAVDPESGPPSTDAHPITGTRGASQPRVSPDGALLAYRSIHGEIWIQERATGSKGPLLTTGTASFNPSWSPDGRFVAYACIIDGASALWLAGADGSDPRQITHGEWNIFHPVWHPDGTHIVFISDRDGPEDLYSLELESGAIHRLGFDGAANPAIAPDGRTIAYVVPAFSGDDRLRLAAIADDLQSVRTLWDHSIVLDRWAGGKPRFSPDGRFIAFDQPSGPVGADIWALPVERANDEPPIRLTSFKTPSSLLSWFDWSPDGALVVAVTRDPDQLILLEDADRWVKRALR